MNAIRPDEPSLEDVIRAWVAQAQQEMHTAFPGRVQKYDARRQVADIEPLVRHAVLQPEGDYAYEAMPLLPSVPVVFPRAGAWQVSFPLGAGDGVLVVCCESAIGHWRAGDGSPQYPGDPRRFDLSHAVAIPGLFARGKALQSASADDLVVGHDTDPTARAVFKHTGGIELAGGAQFVALAAYVDARIEALRLLFNAHVHGGGTISGNTAVPTATVPTPYATVAAAKVKAT